MKIFIHTILLLSAVFLTLPAAANSFAVSSTDITHGEYMSKAQEFKEFGCEGGNSSPQLSWSGAPKETKAFAVFAYDPDAPTGSGWWHWQLVNIDRNVKSLPSNLGDITKVNQANSMSLQ